MKLITDQTWHDFCRMTAAGGSERGTCPCSGSLECLLQDHPDFPPDRKQSIERTIEAKRQHALEQVERNIEAMRQDALKLLLLADPDLAAELEQLAKKDHKN